MVVGVLEVDLEEVVVDVEDGGLDLDAVASEHLELHQRHRPGGVNQRLVDGERDLGARDQLAPGEVVVEDRAGSEAIEVSIAGALRPLPTGVEIVVRGDAPTRSPRGRPSGAR